MNRFSSLIISILLGVLPAVAQQTYTMTGMVRDAETKEALSFATIQLNSLKKNNYAAITATDGHYRLIGLPAGTYTVTISYLGYQTYIKEVTIIKNTSLTFYLTSASPDSVLLGMAMGRSIDTDLVSVVSFISCEKDTLARKALMKEVSENFRLHRPANENWW